MSYVLMSCVYVVGGLISSTVDTPTFEWALHTWIRAAWTQSKATFLCTRAATMWNNNMLYNSALEDDSSSK